jgi:hypothetical protein
MEHLVNLVLTNLSVPYACNEMCVFIYLPVNIKISNINM